MNKTINALEKERIERLRELSPDEVKRYLENLNIKTYDAFAKNNIEEIDFYNKKILEVNNILKDKYNLSYFIMSNKFSIVLSDLMIERVNSKYEFFEVIESIIFDYSEKLYKAKWYLESILQIYYFNYHNRIGISVTDAIDMELWEKLPEDEFNNLKLKNHYEDDFYHKMLLVSFDRVIGYIRDDMLECIGECDEYIEKIQIDKAIEYAKSYFEGEKEYIFNNISDESNRILKDRGYLDSLLEKIKVLENLRKTINVYVRMRDNVLDLIDGDAFELHKEMDYSFYKKNFSNPISDKESYVRSKPSYNIRNLELIAPESKY